MQKSSVIHDRVGRGGGTIWLVATLVAMLLASAISVGCGSSSDSTSGSSGGEGGGTEVSQFAIATPEAGNDYGWNQQAVEAANKVADELGIEVDVADNSGYDDISPILRDLSTSGAQLVIAQASGYNTTAPDVAQSTGVPELVWDNPQANAPEISADASTASQQGAYLAGVLAAKSSKAGKLGIVISADDVNWNKQSGGFIAGARATDPNIEIELVQIGQAGYADTAGGKRVTETLIADGADIIFGMGDGSSFGMLQAVDNADGVQFIDVIGNKTPVDKQGVLLSSVLWNFEGVYKDAISDVENGSFGERSYELDLNNGGIDLLKTPQVSDDAWSAVEDAKAKIMNGDIKVPLTEKKSQVDALLNKG